MTAEQRFDMRFDASADRIGWRTQRVPPEMWRRATEIEKCWIDNWFRWMGIGIDAEASR